MAEMGFLCNTCNRRWIRFLAAWVGAYTCVFCGARDWTRTR